MVAPTPYIDRCQNVIDKRTPKVLTLYMKMQDVSIVYIQKVIQYNMIVALLRFIKVFGTDMPQRAMLLPQRRLFHEALERRKGNVHARLLELRQG